MITLGNEARRRLLNGLDVTTPDTSLDGALVRLYDSAGAFLGIGERLSAEKLIPKRLVSQVGNPETRTTSDQLSP